MPAATALDPSASLSAAISPASDPSAALIAPESTSLLGRASDPASAIATNPDATYLSDLSWMSASNGWGTAERDMSNGEQLTGDGQTLTLNGVTYSKGLGVHAGSEITYALNGRYTQFLSDIGVDDEVGKCGSVVFQIWADGVQLYDSGLMTGNSTTKSVTVDLTGKQTLKLVVTTNGDDGVGDHADWANAQLWGGGNGLKGDYFSGTNFDTLKLSRIDASVDFNWQYGSPDPVLNPDQFSVRWTGQVQPTQSQTYTFYTNSDDGVRLWVNGQPVVNNWTLHGTTENQGAIALEAGKKYDIKLEYFENTGSAISQLMWSSPSQPKQAIPQAQLFSNPLPKANSKPVIIVPGAQSAVAGTGLALSDIHISDVDAGNSQLTVMVSATNGALAVNSNVSGGVSMSNIKNNGTGSVVLVGTLMQISATLANPAGLLYTSNPGFVGNDAVQVMVNDNGNSGTGGAQTDTQSVAVKVYSTNDPRAYASVGANLSGVTDWSTQWPFVDVFKTSRPWIPQRTGAGWGQGGALKLTPEGWIASLEPGQYAETVMMSGQHFPAGQYTLLYDGEGKLEFSFANAKVISQSPGKMVVEVKPDDAGIFLKETATNPNNPLRNIRFIMPGFENTYQTQPFNPTFLERLSQFKTLRFMDWESTNNSILQTWENRTTPNSATQAGPNGVSLEYMIQLANTLKIDPWFTIPAQASDEYVRQFATLVRDRLDPSLKAHVEYSNETWNSMFSQANYVTQKGLALGLDSSGFTAGLRYYSQRAVQVFGIWETVFGSSTKNRVLRVMSGQASNAWTAEQVLGWQNAYQHVDEYAIAPYFDGNGDADHDGWSDINDADNVNTTLKMTPDQIIDSFLAEIPTEMKQEIDANYAVATKRFGVDLVAYEGGQHLISYQFGDKEPQMTALFAAVNRSPRMQDVYTAYLNQWKASGGKLFNQFTDVAPITKWGSWGALEYQNQDPTTAPKYEALLDFIKTNTPH